MGIIKFIRSLYTAFQGLVHVVKSERNARFHLLATIIVLSASVILGISNTELAAIFFAIIIVFVAEVVNTAIEKTLDLLHPDENAQVRVIKDIAAAAVLVAAIGAVGIGVAVFYPYVLGVVWRQ
ncbi:MAG TPA: diacylglycerol kinase family protein [Candidatus Saccharimonadales bacterium]|nr:diacylglycerol kinase family protein [Candidatus Saccharimonadales bacterium]